jgi:hypothetical protein
MPNGSFLSFLETLLPKEGGHHLRHRRRRLTERALAMERALAIRRSAVVPFDGVSAMSEHKIPVDLLACILSMTDLASVRVAR